MKALLCAILFLALSGCASAVEEVTQELQERTLAAGMQATQSRMRTIGTLGVVFLLDNKRYPDSLQEMVNVGLIPPEYLSIQGGYQLVYASNDSPGYELHAEPIDKGGRYFYTDETNVVRSEIGKKAGPQSAEYK